MVRGYPLPFDPSDPAVKKVGTYKVINGQDDAMKRSASNASLGSGNNNNANNGPNKPNSGYQSDGEGYRKENNRLGGLWH